MLKKLPIADARTSRTEAAALIGWHRTGLVVLIVLHACAVLTGLLAPWLLGDIVAYVETGTGWAGVDVLAALIAAALVVHTAFTAVSQRQSFAFGERIFARLRETYMDRLLRVPVTDVERAGTGDVVSRSTNDIDAVQEIVRIGIPEVLVGIMATCFTLAAALAVDWKLGLAAMVGLPVIAVVTRWFALKMRPAAAKELATNAEATATILETVRGALTVTSLGRGRNRLHAIDDAAGRLYAAKRRTLFLEAVWIPLVQVGYNLPLIAVLGIGTVLVANDQTTAGELATVALYVRMLQTPVDDLIFWYSELQSGGAAFARIVGVKQANSADQASTVPPHSGRLEAHDIGYAYVPGRPVLSDISLSVGRGEHVAIVGPSGAGKSTLGLILAGVLPRSQGRVTFGGVELAEVDPDVLRDRVALVTQENHLFTGTLADNLRLGRDDAPLDTLRDAMKAVGATWIDDLDAGLDTVTAPDGVDLSPAQRQQVALARVLIKDPAVIILDEAMSALANTRSGGDAETSMLTALNDRTVVSVAHQLDVARAADRVVYMAHGRIVEMGTHDELHAAGGQYARLWQSWK